MGRRGWLIDFLIILFSPPNFGAGAILLFHVPYYSYTGGLCGCRYVPEANRIIALLGSLDHPATLHCLHAYFGIIVHGFWSGQKH